MKSTPEQIRDAINHYHRWMDEPSRADEILSWEIVFDELVGDKIVKADARFGDRRVQVVLLRSWALPAGVDIDKLETQGGDLEGAAKCRAHDAEALVWPLEDSDE